MRKDGFPSQSTGLQVLAVSSGKADRQINLVGAETYELSVQGGADSYKRIESEELPAGTYSIEREGTNNVRLGVVVLKFIDDSATGMETIENQSAALKVLRQGQVVIIRDGKSYNILGTRID